jgi:hypothetical protein
MFCSHCGSEVKEGDKYCQKCGAPIEKETPASSFKKYVSEDLKNMASFKSDNPSPCSRLAAALLCFFLGGFGAHRFYVGKTTSAVFMLLFFWTFVPCIIAIVDFIMILCGTFTDSEGRQIKSL